MKEEPMVKEFQSVSEPAVRRNVSKLNLKSGMRLASSLISLIRPKITPSTILNMELSRLIGLWLRGKIGSLPDFGIKIMLVFFSLKILYFEDSLRQICFKGLVLSSSRAFIVFSDFISSMNSSRCMLCIRRCGNVCKFRLLYRLRSVMGTGQISIRSDICSTTEITMWYSRSIENPIKNILLITQFTFSSRYFDRIRLFRPYFGRTH